MSAFFIKPRATARIAVAQLRDHPLRTLLVITGVAMAVLSVTLLAGTGMGVLDTGEQQFEAADRDLWVTSGETGLTPTGGGGFENTITNSRTVATQINAHEDVRSATPLAFETIYVDSGDGDFETIIATGVEGTGSSVQISSGNSFSAPGQHYANGSYDGQMAHEIIIDRRTADRLNVSIGDTVRAGGSLSIAREHEFTVVGISPTISSMLGTPTVVLPLGEFHTITGTSETEPATFIVVTLEDGASPEAVATELRRTHPELAIRTNQEQLEAVLGEQVLVLAAGVALVGLALVTGLLLTAHVLTLLVHQQRDTFAALAAQGCSRTTIASIVAWQGFILGILGGGAGVIVTPVCARVLNTIGTMIVGYEGLVIVDPRLLAVGAGMAIVIGTLSAAIAGRRAIRGSPLTQLQ